MAKERVEIRTSKDPFDAAEKLRKLKGVFSSNVIEVNTVVVFYDTRKIKESDLVNSLFKKL